MDARNESNTDRAAKEAGGVVLTEQQQKRRRARNLAIGLAVVLFMSLIYVVTLVKLGGAASHPPV